MRVGLVEIFDESKTSQNRGSFDWVARDTVYGWIETLSRWNFEEIVLLGDDCLAHPEFDEIVSYLEDAASDPRIFTNCQYLSSGDLRDLNRSDVTPIVPIDWVDPVQGEIYGATDYNEITRRGIERLRDVEVWQGISESNLDRVESMMSNAVRGGFDWRGHPVTDPPDDLVRAASERDLPIVHPENWMFVHHRGEIPEGGAFEDDVRFGRDEYTGCLHIDSDGILRSRVSDREDQTNLVSRGDLVEWAL